MVYASLSVFLCRSFDRCKSSANGTTLNVVSHCELVQVFASKVRDAPLEGVTAALNDGVLGRLQMQQYNIFDLIVAGG